MTCLVERQIRRRMHAYILAKMISSKHSYSFIFGAGFSI